MTEWYYRLGEEVQGPVSLEDLKHIFESGALPGETQVWCEGMQDWGVAMEISGPSRCFKPASPKSSDSTETSIRYSNQDVAAKKKRISKLVFVSCVLLLVAASIFYFGRIFHTKKSSAVDLSSEDTSSTYPQNVQQPETAHDDFITVDPRTISNPYMTTDLYGPAVLGRLSSISKTDLDLVESRGLSEQQSLYTVLLIHKYEFNVVDILSDWDAMHAKNSEYHKWKYRNIDLWISSDLNAFLAGKVSRGETK